MMPSHAVKKGTRYRYYVSRSLITKDRTEGFAALRVPAGEIEQLVTSRVRRWLVGDPNGDRRRGSVCRRETRRAIDQAAPQGAPVQRDTAESESVPFAALAQREGVSRSYFTRLVRLSYLAPDITQAILDGRQPPDLTTEKLLAHSRLPLAWHDRRTVLGFA
jgi:hypothetical protein